MACAVRHSLAACFFFAGLSGLMSPACAQDAASYDELKRVIEVQQGQLEDFQKQLKSLREIVEAQSRSLEEYKQQHEAEIAVAAAGEPQLGATEVPPGESVQTAAEITVPVSDWGRYDTETPTNTSVSYFGPARKAMVPGEKTRVAVHGLLELQILHDTVGLNNNRFDTVYIPIEGGEPQTKFNVNPTQLAVSSITSAPSGTFNTWLSIDFNGQLDRPDPRLRVGFAEYVNTESNWALLAGQTYSTMLDMRAIPETLDFALPAGVWQQRQPLVRFSKAFSDTFSGELSAETPENVTYEDHGGDAEKLTLWPDFVAAGTWFTDNHYVKHFRVAALLRDLRVEGSNGAKDSAIGWSMSGSTKVALPFLGERDTLRLTAHFGDGYGTQLKGGPVEGLFDTGTSSLETMRVFGTFGAIQHFWSDKFRSNLAFGHVEVNNPDIVHADALKSTSYLAINYIWSPVKTTKFGVEYLWGRRENENGESGSSNRFLLSSMVQF